MSKFVRQPAYPTYLTDIENQLRAEEREAEKGNLPQIPLRPEPEDYDAEKESRVVSTLR